MKFLSLFLTRKLLLLIGVFLLLIGTTSCFDDQDDVSHPPSQTEVKNFVYQGLKYFYLYKPDIPELADDHFNNSDDLIDFLSSYDTPESLFNHLLSDEDRFSIIVPDFIKLENELNGISLNNGMAFGLVQINSSEVFGYVRYVMPNSSADNNGIERGMIFSQIDGTPLSTSNYNQLLKPTTYTITLADFDGSSLHPNGTTYTLTKSEYTEDPIFAHKTFNIQGHNIGYLMYNSFTASFDDDLNQVFGEFAGQGVTDLIVDLRYNSGGSIESSKTLAGMITGQFTGDLFAHEIYNDNFSDQDLLFADKTRSGAGLFSLNLNKVYIITGPSTASASELLINGLNPYIDLVQIGSTTVGKFQGSTTIYDSPDFSRAAVRPGHTYAMQPLVLKTANADGFTDYADGLPPDIHQEENYNNLGILGDTDEPLLHKAIEQIVGGNFDAILSTDTDVELKEIGNNRMNQINYQRMYIDHKNF